MKIFYTSTKHVDLSGGHRRSVTKKQFNVKTIFFHHVDKWFCGVSRRDIAEIEQHLTETLAMDKSEFAEFVDNLSVKEYVVKMNYEFMPGSSGKNKVHVCMEKLGELI